MDTVRPIIAPIAADDDDGRDAPLTSRWFGFSIILGALLGTLIVAWVYIEDHPVVPVPARFATNSVKAPTKTPAAPSKPAAPIAAPVAAAAGAQATHGGFIAIPGPPGARVFDGEVLIGIAPFMYGTNAGAHLIRVSALNKSQTFNVEVRAFETTPIVASFDTADRSRTKHRVAPAPFKKAR